jgi:UDP-N-acetylmuramate--alanine ligase
MVKYGFDNSADVYALNVTLQATYSTFDVYKKDSVEKLGTITSTMLGRHNVLNTLAATAVALDLGISFETIANAIASFKGIERRFCFKGLFQGAEVFDDYGHHPKEIYNTLLVAKRRAKKKLIVVFQPHRYTRTDKLWQEFIKTFKDAEIDHLIVTDIYAASEAPILNVTSPNLVHAIAQEHPAFTISYAPYESDFATIKDQLKPLAHEDDLVLLLGAGKVNKLAECL